MTVWAFFFRSVESQKRSVMDEMCIALRRLLEKNKHIDVEGKNVLNMFSILFESMIALLMQAYY